MWLCSSYGYEVKALIKRWIVWSKWDVFIIFRRGCSCRSAFTLQVSHAWEEVCLRVCALWSILRLRWAAAVLCETSTSANLCDGVRHTGNDANARVCLCVWKDVEDARFRSSETLAASLCRKHSVFERVTLKFGCFTDILKCFFYCVHSFSATHQCICIL